jgi:hypothetical protein
MTQACQHEIYLPYWYYMLEEWTNNLCIIPLGWRRRMAWWHFYCRSPSHNEPWPEKIESPTELLKCVDTLFGCYANTGVLQRGWPSSYALAHPHSLKFQGKLEYPIYQTGWPDFDRFSLHRRCASMTEIGPTSTQAASGQGKTRNVSNLGVSGGRDWWEEEEEFEVEGEVH